MSTTSNKFIHNAKNPSFVSKRTIQQSEPDAKILRRCCKLGKTVLGQTVIGCFAPDWAKNSQNCSDIVIIACDATVKAVTVGYLRSKFIFNASK